MCPLSSSEYDIAGDIGIPCYIPSICTGIQCCVYAKELGRSFEVSLVVDPCNNVFSVGIETFIHNISVTSLELGKCVMYLYDLKTCGEIKTQTSNQVHKIRLGNNFHQTCPNPKHLKDSYTVILLHFQFCFVIEKSFINLTTAKYTC